MQIEARPGAKCECLSKLVVRLKHDRTDDDAQDERNEEDLCDCFFPQYIVSPGTSLTMRRTKCEVRRDSCDIVSFKTVRRRVAQTSSQVMCGQLQTSSVRSSRLFVCSQTLASRSSSKNSSFPLDAG